MCVSSFGIFSLRHVTGKCVCNFSCVITQPRNVYVFCCKFEDVWKRYQDLNQALGDKDDLEFTLKRTILERDHLKCDLAKVTEERDELEPKLHELRARVRDLSHVEAENASLESQVASVNRSLKERVTCSHLGGHMLHAFTHSVGLPRFESRVFSSLIFPVV